MVRFEQDPNFVGRENELKEVEERFKEQHRVVLSGIGGVGYVMSLSVFKSPGARPCERRFTLLYLLLDVTYPPSLPNISQLQPSLCSSSYCAFYKRI